LRQISADWNAGVLWRRCPPASIIERFAPERHIADLLTLCQYVSASNSRLGTSDQPDSLKTNWP
jgi:hypothetical protein